MTDLVFEFWSKRRDQKLAELRKLLSIRSRVTIQLGRSGGLLRSRRSR